MSAATILSLEPTLIMQAGLSLLVLAVGIHGAQKRNARALYFYGVFSLASIVVGIVAFAFLTGFLMFGGFDVPAQTAAQRQFAHQGPRVAHPHSGHSMWRDMAAHGGNSFMDMMQRGGIVALTPPSTATADESLTFGKPQTAELLLPKQDGADAADDDNVPVLTEMNVKGANGESFELVGIRNNKNDNSAKEDEEQPKVVGGIQELSFPRRHGKNAGKSSSSEQSSSEESDKDSGNDNDNNSTEDDNVTIVTSDFEITPFGWALASVAIVLGLIVFVLKIKSIRLAFQMRRMLLESQPQLPVRAPAATPSSGAPVPVQMSTPPTGGVRPPTGPAPQSNSVSRVCARCTYNNAPGAVRCAMCDSALPIVAGAATIVAPSAPVPRVYVPGSLYPLNSPLN